VGTIGGIELKAERLRGHRNDAGVKVECDEMVTLAP
jgi:hypothetical protein